VFSWSQARFFIPGWFGVGAALEALLAEDACRFAEIQAHLSTWAPLHYALSNAATSLSSSDRDVMSAYARLVVEPEERDRVFALITDEFDRTLVMLERVYGGPLAERRPNIHARLVRRKEPLRTLHRRQIALLHAWREARSGGDPEGAGRLLPSLILTVNAIASGLGATG
jgi:phosphoenolpyruvate carboxylase